MANQESKPAKKSKFGIVAVLSVVVVILFIVLIGLIGSTSDKPKTSPKNEIAQNKNAKISNAHKAENKEDIADVFLISNWQFSSSPNYDTHQYSFVLQNKSDRKLNLNGTAIYLYIYDKDDVLIGKNMTWTNLPASLNSGDKVKILENFHGNLKTAAWGKIVLTVMGGGEYSSEKWKLNFSGGKAILGNTAQNIEQSTKEDTQQIAKQTTEQLPAGNSNGNNKDSKSVAAQALDDEYQKKIDELTSLGTATARQYGLKNPKTSAELSRLAYEKAVLDVKYGKEPRNIVGRLIESATLLVDRDNNKKVEMIISNLKKLLADDKPRLLECLEYLKTLFLPQSHVVQKAIDDVRKG